MNGSFHKNRVSVIIPVYNASLFLKRCLKSVLEQSYSDLEILIIDDGSTDESPQIIHDFLNDKRIILIKKLNSGPSDTRNKGLEYAKGEYVFFLDSDDYLPPLAIEILVESMSRIPQVDLVVGNYFELSNHTKNPIPIQQIKEGIFSSEEFSPHLFQGTMGVLWGKLFKNEILKKHNLTLQSNIQFQEDFLFLFSYLLKIESILSISEFVYFYNRQNESSLTNKLSPNHLQEFRKVQEALNKMSNSEKHISLIKERQSQFYHQYIISLAQNHKYIDFKNHLKEVDFKSFSKDLQGKKIYKIYFKLLSIHIRMGYTYMRLFQFLKNRLNK